MTPNIQITLGQNQKILSVHFVQQKNIKNQQEDLEPIKTLIQVWFSRLPPMFL